MAECKFKAYPEQPCVIDHGDYCYSAQLVTDLPICRTCMRSPEQTGIPKPNGFDVMIQEFKRQQFGAH